MSKAKEDIEILLQSFPFKDYEEINEVLRKDQGLSKEEWYIDGVRGIHPSRMMKIFPIYFPDGAGWYGDVCVVLGKQVDYITVLLKDGEYLRRKPRPNKEPLPERKGWRIAKKIMKINSY